MKLLVEGHPYPFESIRELFPNIDELDVVDGVASVNYVGYYYYAEKVKKDFPEAFLVKVEDGSVERFR